MSFATATDDDAFMDEEISFIQNEIQRAALALREEVILAIDHQLALYPERRPRIPIFFITGVNFLKEECASIGYQDPVVESFPQQLEMLMLSPPGTLLEFRDGLLVDPSFLGTLRTEIGQFFRDTVSYCRDAFRVTGALPRLPISYMMSLVHFRQRNRANPADAELELVESIPALMQEHISYNLGKSIVPDDYVERGGALFNF